ncbi:cytokine receptor [Chelonus insularis]|uniref:cytokine receptor n=1 Tax=Chelonus insularis TaxID=460826 RepID=UPI00158A320B|nr:cytokine receptor [Chelonus insularis]XP_034948372.1 cytokine receptor [Chelonus insularis]XP_034948373.1 cytokine receptor [Chelonus insularis]XP_034948374.1 cytokine receptor [Chelonus insularis]
MLTVTCLPWSTQKMQLPKDANSSDLLKRGHNRTDKQPSMVYSDIEMCNEKLGLNSSCKNSRLNYKSKNFGPIKRHETNNTVCYDNKLSNLRKNTQQPRFCIRDTSCNRKHLIPSSECVLNNNCVVSTNKCSKFSELIMKKSDFTTSEYFFNKCFKNCQRRFSSPYIWQTLIVIFISLICTTSANQCAAGLKTPGRTWPAGDIVLEYGQPLRILCMLNKTYVDAEFPSKNSSNLMFFRNDKKMEPEYITVLNETTIEMYIEKPPPAKDMYYCKLKLDGHVRKDEAVCLNSVVIGFKPQAPKNFSCVSYNWENLKCTWNPVENYVKTTFTLAFKLSGRKFFPCPREKDYSKPLPPNTCIWDLATNPIYRQSYENYTFMLNIENVLGVTSVVYKFHHYAHVIPAKPEDLSVINKTSESALLYWSVPFPMQNFPPGLHHRIAYQHQWDRQKTWQVINIDDDVHEDKRYYNLTGLEFANTVYDVRVFLKSALAKEEDRWSQFSDLTFRTSPKLPGSPPRTDIGSFEIMENNASRDVYLYWQTIPSYLENGDNFKYQVVLVEENNRKLHITSNETTRSYAIFKGIGFNNYRFEIFTSNVVGLNPKNASIFVPSRFEMPHEPLAVTKIAFEEGLYELSWKPPIMSAEITNYTIFWCDNERDRPYQCTGYLDWVHVSKNTTIHNITVPDPRKVYQFAVSANTEKGSSGMVWASCTVIHNKVVGKMKSVWINRIGSDDIDVGWKLDCSDRIGIVEGFKIYYCPIVSPKNATCKEPKKNTTIRAEPHTIHGLVTGLKPYTTYMITIAFWTKSGEGLESDPLYNTTLEAAPAGPPQNVRVGNVTNSTMFVSWDPPTAMNGVLREYEVFYSGNSIKVFDSINHVLLRDLLAHKNYSIRVRACTVECSVTSRPIYALTHIGVPGKIHNIPTVRFFNSSQVTVNWTKPSNPGGNLNYYQISSDGNNIQNSTKLETQITIPDCKAEGRERMYQFKVRAVNIDSDGTHLFGPWSETGEGSCYSDGPPPKIWVIIWIISGLSGIAFIFCVAYTSKKMWLKCKVMQDVEVKLPPGLAGEKLLQKVGEQHLRQSSADSSGCSSGQESVTSSLTADSHVSNDSGTETDPVSVLPNKLLETPATWETSSLRQRNVSSAKPNTLADSNRWDSYVKVSKSGETNLDDTLSLARSTPNLTDNSESLMPPQTWSSTGYISMPSSEEISTNSSPVPQETSNIGSYSVVGIMPKVSRSKVEEPSESLKNALLNCKADAKPNIPYVSLASVDKKSKEQPMDSLRDLDKLAFIGSTPIAKVETLKPISTLDSTNKPYVQTGLIDNLKKPFSPSSTIEPNKDSLNTTFTTAIEPRNKQFASKFSSPNVTTYSVTESATKPYVTVASIAEIKSPKPTVTSLDDKTLLKSRSSDTSHKPYVQASTVFKMLKQQPRASEEMLCSTKDSEIDKSLSATYPHYWESDDLDSTAVLQSEKSLLQDDEHSSSKETMKSDEQLDRYRANVRQTPSSGETVTTVQHILD